MEISIIELEKIVVVETWKERKEKERKGKKRKRVEDFMRKIPIKFFIGFNLSPHTQHVCCQSSCNEIHSRNHQQQQQSFQMMMILLPLKSHH